MKVVYKGTSNIQKFWKRDFEKVGIDQKAISFTRGEAVEVSDEVGKVLTSKEGLFGPYAFEEVKEENDEELSFDDTPEDKSPKKAAARGSAH